MSRNFTGFCLIATVCVFLIAYMFHAEIFSIFVAAEYASVSYLLPWVMLSSGIFAAGQAMAFNLMSRLETRVMVSVKIVTALVGIAGKCCRCLFLRGHRYCNRRFRFMLCHILYGC